MSISFSATDRPYLPRGVRLCQDKLRGCTMLLAPEKAIELDEIGVAILSRINGEVTFEHLVQDLATTYDAPVSTIQDDVQAFLTRLRARLYVMVHS